MQNQDPFEALFQAYGKVRELEIDEEFAEHMAEVKRQYPKHQISPVEVIEVHQNELLSILTTWVRIEERP